MILRCEHVPENAIPVLAANLRAFGCEIQFHTDTTGVMRSPAGTILFSHDAGCLQLQLVEDHKHFPPRMIVGGIRQMIEETLEGLGSRGKLRVVQVC